MKRLIKQLRDMFCLRKLEKRPAIRWGPFWSWEASGSCVQCFKEPTEGGRGKIKTPSWE